MGEINIKNVVNIMDIKYKKYYNSEKNNEYIPFVTQNDIRKRYVKAYLKLLSEAVWQINLK